MKIAQTVAFAAGLALTASASAQTLQFSAGAAGPFNSAGAVGDVDNGSFTYNYAGAAFTVGDVIFTGNITDGGVGTWQSEASVAITNPGGVVGSVALGSGQTFAGTVAIGPNTISGGSALWGNDVVGNWNFEFFESFDDPTSTESGPLNAAEVTWYSFDVSGGAGAQPWSIDTFGSTNTGGSFADDDTEIGLFDSAGNLIASNDDADFGAGILTSILDDSTVGALADGTYYVAVGSFNTVYGPGFDATSTSTATGTNVVNFNFVPAPASAALLGLGGLAAIRRRR